MRFASEGPGYKKKVDTPFKVACLVHIARIPRVKSYNSELSPHEEQSLKMMGTITRATEEAASEPGGPTLRCSSCKVPAFV